MFWLSLPVQRLVRLLAATTGAVVRVQRTRRSGGDMVRALAELQARARELRELLAAGVFEEGDGASLTDWANAAPWRVALRARVLGGLAVLESQPTAALEPVGLATMQLAADLLAAWAGGVTTQIEERAQLGDVALVALAASGAGVLRAFAAAGLASITADDIEAMKAAAKDAAGDLVGQIPWWGWLLIAVAARQLFR